MDKAELRVVPETMSLSDALHEMQVSGHAAALVRTSRGMGMLTIDQALGELRVGQAKTAADVGSLIPPTFLPQRTAETNWIRRPEVTQGLAYALGGGERRYAILRESEGAATVITADPLLAEAFNLRIALCRCTEHPQTHVFQPHELNQGRCPLDDSEVDCG